MGTKKPPIKGVNNNKSLIYITSHKDNLFGFYIRVLFQDIVAFVLVFFVLFSMHKGVQIVVYSP